MENKKKWIISGVLCMLVMLCIGGFLWSRSNREEPEQILKSYIASLQKNDYDAMYRCVKTDYKKNDFIAKVKHIYEGMKMHNLQYVIKEIENKDDGTYVMYQVEMHTIAGKISYKNKAHIVKQEDTYKIQWDVSQIFPSLKKSDRVMVHTLKAQRGSILDRNGNALAKQGIVYKIGFVAGSMKNEGTSFQQMASTFHIKEESIQKAMQASWIKKDMFVPIVSISEKEKNEKINALQQIDGISIQKSVARIYPYGEMFAHVTGYMQNISSDELKKYKEDGYTTHSMIGKSGLEQVYEKELKAKDGYEIVIMNTHDDVVSTLAKLPAKNGKDVVTTLDIRAQQSVYEQIKNDAGAGIVLDAHSGEVLALLSMPSYDPNDFVLGIRKEQWDAYNNEQTTPLLNRATSTYAPGSTFKAITGAIAINDNIITPNTTFEKCAQWQKDKSWGNHYVTTTRLYNEPSNLLNAFRYSDNIFFAQVADKIGVKTYKTYLDRIGFQEDIKFPLSFTKSTYGSIKDAQSLAATGYGQGELLVSPLHLTALYTAFQNNGTILKPYMIYDKAKPHVWKEHAFSKDSANIIKNDLVETMHSYGANPSQAGGKTGTAQVKNGNQEIGWLCAINDKIGVTIMIDETKDKGQSLYVIPKVQTFLSSYP